MQAASAGVELKHFCLSVNCHSSPLQKSKWETQLDTVAERETCSRAASRSPVWSTSPPISRCTRLETLLTSRVGISLDLWPVFKNFSTSFFFFTRICCQDVVLSRRVCPTRPTMARLDVFSTFPSAPSASLSTSVLVVRINAFDLSPGGVSTWKFSGKILPKRICVRVEHVKHSQCRKDFLDR